MAPELMAPELSGRLIDATCAVIDDHAELRTRLDSAIGDGDHGRSMRGGFQAIAAQRDELVGLPLGAALQKAGMALVMKVGGASGPLYGSLLMSMGKAADEVAADAGGIAAFWAEGIEAVKRRGKSEAGEKTMLDVLVPAQRALRTAAADGLPPEQIVARVRKAAEDGTFGIADRGVLRPGAFADCNVIDPEQLALPVPEYWHDFPHGAGRYAQRAAGYAYTLVNGRVFLEDGRHSGELAGRVLRG
jgi:dihydroxyacetone kinase-like protein